MKRRCLESLVLSALWTPPQVEPAQAQEAVTPALDGRGLRLQAADPEEATCPLELVLHIAAGEKPVVPDLHEGDAFLRFRAAVAKAALELRADRTSKLTEAAARSLFGDVIAPELARIEILAKETKRRALSGASGSVLGWGAALTFGLYSGLLPAELAEAAKLLGATGIVKELVAQLANLQGADTAVRQESYYFLWRARRLSRGKQDA
jgi:hypothetical protein